MIEQTARDHTTNRQKQAMVTRERIYQTAITLMEKKGYQNITIEEISRSAGVSVGAFYHYFKSKNEIFAEIFNQADRYFQTEVAPNLPEQTADRQIVAYFEYYAKYNQRVGFDTIRLLYHPDNQFFAQPQRPMQALLREIICTGQAAQQITSDSSAEELCRFLFTAARGIVYDWCINGGHEDLLALTQQYMRRLVRVLAP